MQQSDTDRKQAEIREMTPAEVEARKVKLMQQLAACRTRRWNKGNRGLVPPHRPPRYDDVYWDGLAWLNSL